MKIIYTLHAKEKLKRKDIKNLKITGNLLRSILKNPQIKSKTKYGDITAITALDTKHDIRIIYDIITPHGIKIITFHVSKKGRYR